MTDPKIRKDSTCVVCRKPLPRVKPQRGVPPQLYIDPFCSTSCCKRWHNQPDLDAKAHVRQSSNPHRAFAPKGGAQHGTLKSYRLCACELCMGAKGG